MGFYGNVTNTSKTTFSFDLIYTTRADMDLNSNLDGVFLGRYVLIDYGEDPIKGYFNPENSLFYNTPTFTTGTHIIGKDGMIYQDINNVLAANSFYKYDKAKQQYVPITTNSPYQERFSTDVKAYGRGYDSTVWVKRYDIATNAYKYVMIAELNAVVPTFHMVVDAPNGSPVPPYFDRDTTNIDYYLHMQGDFGSRVKKAQDGIKSDEVAVRKTLDWQVDNSGYQYYIEREETVDADIYYNQAGFDEKKRTFMTDQVTYTPRDDKGNTIPGAPTLTIDYSQNAIGYDMGRSKRLYGAEADLGIYQEGKEADDIYDWYFRLPGIGNAICKMWDKVYDDRGNGRTRALNKALMRDDLDEHLVSYNKTALIGMMNTTQDLLGYHFIPLAEPHIEGAQITEPTMLTVTLEPDHGVENYTAEYQVLDCLFYQTVDHKLRYYQYAFDPIYTVTDTVDENGEYYYLGEDDLYHLANAATYTAKDADGKPLNYETYYTRSNRWTLKALDWQSEDSLYALINNIHKIIGTNAEDVRNIDTMVGCIDIIKDIIANIKMPLSPGKIVHTNNQGAIETTNTYFPSATWDRDEVLDGNGDWVSRFATVKILNNSENANQNAPKVNVITDGVEENVNKTIVSDNDKTNYGTSLVNNKKHTTNNLTLGTRNKWIELYGDEGDDSVEFKHATSPIISRLRSEQATGTEYLDMYTAADENGNTVLQDSTGYQNFSINDKSTEIKVEPTTDTLSYVSGINDQDDNRLTIPYLTVDNAGHVVELGTKNFNVPHTYKHITLTEQSSSEDFITPTNGDQEADLLTDRLTFSTGNQWIEARIDEDQLTFAHAAIDAEADQNWEFKPTAFETDTDLVENQQTPGWEKSKKDGNEITIPTFEIDNAGHIVRWDEVKFYIPNNFRSIALDPQSYAETAMETSNGTQEPNSLNDIFTFATGNQWIVSRIDEDKITLAHALIDENANQKWEFKSIATEGWQLSSADGNKLTIPTFEIDNAGHIVRTDSVDFYIPHNFRDISVVSATGDDVNSVQTNGKLEANSTVDGWSIAAQNKWLRIAAFPEDDQITIGHSYSTQAEHDFMTDVEISSAIDGTNQKDNLFTFPMVKTDNAGHIIGYSTDTLYIPHNFKSIEVTTDNNADIDSTQTNGTLVADNIIDTWTIAPQNKWIDIAADVNNDKITIGHKYSDLKAWNFTPSASAALTLDNADNSFTIPTFKTDNAGHIVESGNVTFFVPHTFKNMYLMAQSTATTEVAPSNTAVEISADNITDTFTFATGNKWVQTTGDVTNDKITFSHILSGVTKNTYGTNDATALAPQFGDTFLVPGYAVDEAGHITSSSTHTVKIPQNSYSNDDVTKTIANVITGMSLNQVTGAITTTSQNVGTLTLTGYNLGTTASAAVAATDTLNTAIAKIEAQIKAEASTRQQNDSTLQGNIDKEASTRQQNDSTLQGNIDKEASARATADSTLQGNIDKEVSDRGTAITSAISGEVSARNTAISQASQAIWKDLLDNFNLTLQSPKVNNISMTPIQDNLSVKLETSVINPVENDTYIYTWSNGSTGKSIEVTTAGKYTCKVKREHNGFESTEVMVEINVNTNDIPTPPEPDPEPEVPEV